MAGDLLDGLGIHAQHYTVQAGYTDPLPPFLLTTLFSSKPIVFSDQIVPAKNGQNKRFFHRGCIVKKSTFPAGNEGRLRLLITPKRLPAAARWYSGAS